MGAHVLAMQASRDVEPGERHIAGVGMARVEADISRLPAYHDFASAMESAIPTEPDGYGKLVVDGAEVAAVVVAFVADAWPAAEWWATEELFVAVMSPGVWTYAPAFLAAVDGRVVAIAAPRVP